FGAGVGQSAAAGRPAAPSYALPPADALMRKLRTLLATYRDAGGSNPVLLLHDDARGTELIAALARHGDGLPANVLPLAVNEVTQIGLEAIAAALTHRSSVAAVAGGRAEVGGASPRRWRSPSRSCADWVSAPAAPRPSRPTIRSCSGKACAHSRRRRQRRGRRASRRSAPSVTCCAWRCA